MELHERMRELRRERKETQLQVAQAVGITDRQYQRLKQESRSRDLKTSAHWQTIFPYRWIIWPAAATAAEPASDRPVSASFFPLMDR